MRRFLPHRRPLVIALLGSLFVHGALAVFLFLFPKSDHLISIDPSEVFIEVLPSGPRTHRAPTPRKVKSLPFLPPTPPVLPTALSPTEPVQKATSSSPESLSPSPALPTSDSVAAAAATDTSASDASTGAAMAAYVSAVFKKIESAKKYPRESLLREESGQVLICVTIRPDGQIEDSHIESPSPYESLNQATIRLLSEMGPFPPLPSHLKNSIRIRIPIRYEIHAH